MSDGITQGLADVAAAKPHVTAFTKTDAPHPETLGEVIAPQEMDRPLEADIMRREMKLRGTAHDINRLRTACNEVLKKAEEDGDLEAIRTVSVEPPHPNEP